MLNTLFQGIFDSSTTSVIPVGQFLLCIAVSLVLGIILACAYSYKTRHNGSFVRTLAILPAVVCVVIMMVNGNVGAGVAVAGAFSLVRFRSVPGSAKDIGAIFIAMGSGLITGMGYLGYAAVFTVVLSLIMVAYVHMDLWDRHQISEKQLIITIPEDLDYEKVGSLRIEARQKLEEYRPVSIGQASRISGVSPADISVLLVYLEQYRRNV